MLKIQETLCHPQQVGGHANNCVRACVCGGVGAGRGEEGGAHAWRSLLVRREAIGLARGGLGGASMQMTFLRGCPFGATLCPPCLQVKPAVSQVVCLAPVAATKLLSLLFCMQGSEVVEKDCADQQSIIAPVLQGALKEL